MNSRSCGSYTKTLKMTNIILYLHSWKGTRESLQLDRTRRRVDRLSLRPRDRVLRSSIPVRPDRVWRRTQPTEWTSDAQRWKTKSLSRLAKGSPFSLNIFYLNLLKHTKKTTIENPFLKFSLVKFSVFQWQKKGKRFDAPANRTRHTRTSRQQNPSILLAIHFFFFFFPFTYAIL